MGVAPPFLKTSTIVPGFRLSTGTTRPQAYKGCSTFGLFKFDGYGPTIIGGEEGELVNPSTSCVAVTESPSLRGDETVISASAKYGLAVPAAVPLTKTRTIACGIKPDTCTAFAHSPTGETIGGESSLPLRIGNFSLMVGFCWPSTPCSVIVNAAVRPSSCIHPRRIIDAPLVCELGFA